MYKTINMPAPARRTRRATGREWRALWWLCRHPEWTVVPAILVVFYVRLGAWPVLIVLGGFTLDLLLWARLHPPSFDRWAAPWLRAWWRRWTVYRGRRWTSVLVDCD